MADKPKEKRETREPDSKKEKKTSETVHLSAEELKKISGGAQAGGNPTIGAGH